MSEMRSLNGTTGSQSQSSGRNSLSPVLEIDSWMPSKIEAISPLVDRVMLLIESSQYIHGEEFGVELALREALANAVLHGNREHPVAKVHVRCRCWPGKEITIIVTDQGKGFDFGKRAGEGFLSDPFSEHGRGILLMKAYMDHVHFERGGSEVHMRKVLRTKSRS